MKYSLTFRQRASFEYFDATFWYKKRSIVVAEKFIKAIDEVLEKIATNPTRFRNTYLDFHEARTKKFPFSIVYFVDKDEKRIVVVSIFHFKRNPRKKFTDNP